MSVRSNLLYNRVKLSNIGGYCVKLKNKQGSTILKGQVVKASSLEDFSCDLTTPTDNEEAIGIVLEDIADETFGWIVITGVADILMEDNTAATPGNWVRASAVTGGHGNATLSSPPGEGIPEIDIHFKEIGHCIETVAATGVGTYIIARCIIHFN